MVFDAVRCRFKFFKGSVDINSDLKNGIFSLLNFLTDGRKMGMVLQLKELKAVEPGLFLAEPVLNQFGQTLLPQGVELQARHLKVLKTWGCKTVMVMEDGTSEKEPEVSPEIMDRALARVNWRLKWEPTTNLEKEIFQLAVKRVIQKFLRP
jgi:hypothetical protein